MSIIEGKRAPDFTLPGSDGQNHSLADYRGKTVVLYFYPKDDTPGCTKESCGFGVLHPEWAARDIVVLGVSKDSIASHEKFVAKYTLPFVLLSDPDRNVLIAYGAWGEKLMYGKTVEGTIRSTVIIDPDGNVAQHWPKVTRAATHPEQVAAWFAEQGR